MRQTHSPHTHTAAFCLSFFFKTRDPNFDLQFLSLFIPFFNRDREARCDCPSAFRPSIRQRLAGILGINLYRLVEARGSIVRSGGEALQPKLHRESAADLKYISLNIYFTVVSKDLTNTTNPISI
jgi:hypothetical protein